MGGSAATRVIKEYLSNHDLILTYLKKLSDEQIHWQPSIKTLSIAWHAWHLARWADFTQAAIPGMTPELGKRLPQGSQIWDTDDVAKQWGFDNAQLGFGATGMEMSDEVAQHLSFPPKTELLNYVEKVFKVTEQAVKCIDDEQFAAVEQLQPLTEGVWGESTVGDAVLEHITHDCRHLGMMECLLGLQGQPGTATS
jgi:hypothetical protein